MFGYRSSAGGSGQEGCASRLWEGRVPCIAYRHWQHPFSSPQFRRVGCTIASARDLLRTRSRWSFGYVHSETDAGVSTAQRYNMLAVRYYRPHSRERPLQRTAQTRCNYKDIIQFQQRGDSHAQCMSLHCPSTRSTHYDTPMHAPILCFDASFVGSSASLCSVQ